MTDFIGNQINIGDKAVYCRMLGNRIAMEQVDIFGFTDTKVKITPLSCADDKRGYSLCTPEKLVVYEKAKTYSSNPVANKKHKIEMR